MKKKLTLLTLLFCVSIFTSAKEVTVTLYGGLLEHKERDGESITHHEINCGHKYSERCATITYDDGTLSYNPDVIAEGSKPGTTMISLNDPDGNQLGEGFLLNYERNTRVLVNGSLGVDHHFQLKTDSHE